MSEQLLFYTGEVSDIVGEKPYVITFWETEFPEIKPARSPSNRRIYTRDDIAIILWIKHLLYEQKLTIPGARLQLQKDLQEGKVLNNQLVDIKINEFLNSKGAYKKKSSENIETQNVQEKLFHHFQQIQRKEDSQQSNYDTNLLKEIIKEIDDILDYIEK